jgi:hypothetical protein
MRDAVAATVQRDLGDVAVEGEMGDPQDCTLAARERAHEMMLAIERNLRMPSTRPPGAPVLHAQLIDRSQQVASGHLRALAVGLTRCGLDDSCRAIESGAVDQPRHARQTTAERSPGAFRQQP